MLVTVKVVDRLGLAYSYRFPGFNLRTFELLMALVVLSEYCCRHGAYHDVELQREL